MKEIVVISGKGGTGKTSITASLASRLPNPVLADCDVDAPDLEILLKPTGENEEQFIGTRKARIDADSCDGCGRCIELCKFSALRFPQDGTAEVPEVLDHRCEGCGVCEYVCPKDAITMKDISIGSVYQGQTEYGPMVRARLNPGEESSGKLVFEVRRRAREVAVEKGADYLLVDGPPGIGCSVISAVTNSDHVLVVTEPSVTALHDLERVCELAQGFKLPVSVVINKADISKVIARRIRDYCDSRNVPVMMKLPFSLEIVDAITEESIPSVARPELFGKAKFDRLVKSLI